MTVRRCNGYRRQLVDGVDEVLVNDRSPVAIPN